MPSSSIRNLGIGFPGTDEADCAAAQAGLDCEPGAVPGPVGENRCGLSASARMSAALQPRAMNASSGARAGQLLSKANGTNTVSSRMQRCHDSVASLQAGLRQI